MRTFSRRNPVPFFYLSTLAIIGGCLAVRNSGAFATSPEVAAWGITFDLTISVPALYWILLVRTGRVRPLTMGPVFLLGTLAVTMLLPRAHQEFVRQLATLVACVTPLLVGATMVRHAVASRGWPHESTDPHERISNAARALLGEGRVSEIVASEVTMVYYAFFGWEQRPEPRERSVSFHERSGWGSVVACVLLLIAAEGVAMHLLLMRWSPIAAWAWTTLDVWAMIWFVGDYHALRLRPTWLDERTLHLRHGLRWNISISRAAIASVRPVQDASDWKRRDVLNVAMLEEPRWLITLHEAQIAQGLAGMRKEIRAVALSPDQDEWIAELVTGLSFSSSVRSESR